MLTAGRGVLSDAGTRHVTGRARQGLCSAVERKDDQTQDGREGDEWGTHDADDPWSLLPGRAALA